jgi:YesN/AraC family two-component response regulator
MNGIQMLKKIKNIKPDQKVIVYSAYSEYEYLSSLNKIEIDAFLRKPLETKKMFETIYDTLSRSKEMI